MYCEKTEDYTSLEVWTLSATVQLWHNYLLPDHLRKSPENCWFQSDELLILDICTQSLTLLHFMSHRPNISEPLLFCSRRVAKAIWTFSKHSIKCLFSCRHFRRHSVLVIALSFFLYSLPCESWSLILTRSWNSFHHIFRFFSSRLSFSSLIYLRLAYQCCGALLSSVSKCSWHTLYTMGLKERGLHSMLHLKP